MQTGLIQNLPLIGGLTLLSCYLGFALWVIRSEWNCGGMFCGLATSLVLIPVSWSMPGTIRPSRKTLPLILLGMSVTGAMMYGIGRLVGTVLRWVLTL
jgi:hypothetical protein